MKHLSLCVPMLLVAITVGAQSPEQDRLKKIDSLKNILKNHPQIDTFRINQLNRLALTLYPRDKQRDSLANYALTLAQTLNYAYGQAYSLYTLALSRSNLSNPGANAKLLEKALPLAEQSGNQRLIAYILYNISLDKRTSADTVTALNYMRRSYTAAEATGEAPLVIYFERQIAYLYQSFNEYAQALQWHFQTVDRAEKANLPSESLPSLRAIATIYNNLGNYDASLKFLLKAQAKARQIDNKVEERSILSTIGDRYRLMGQFEQAIKTYREALGDSVLNERTAIIESNIADTYSKQKRYQSAFFYARRAFANASRLEVMNVMARSSIVLGQLHFYTRRMDSALYYGRRGYLLAQQGKYTILLRDASQLLARTYARRKDFTNAYLFQSRYITYRDTLNNEEISRKLLAAEYATDIAKKQGEIDLRKQDAQNQQNLIKLLGISLIVLGLLIFFLLRSYQQRNRSFALLKKQKGEIEKQRDLAARTLDELRITQGQLVHREKMASLGELTAGIAHEIQNPLNFVNNFSELTIEQIEELRQEQAKLASHRDLDLEAELSDNLKTNLERIQFHGERASGIVQRMLEYSKNGNGQRDSVDINALCDQYFQLAYHGLRAKDKSIVPVMQTDFDPSLGLVSVVPQDIGRVLLNLFANAFYAVMQRQKQMGDADYQPTVSIRTHCDNNKVSIAVSDNGVGIAEVLLGKIFQPFFTTKPPGEGIGLGLSLAYEIITMGHNGRLEVKSKQGEGSEFIIILPA